MEYVLGVVLALLGLLFFERSKRKSAEGNLENLETKKEDIQLEKTVEKNKGFLESEEQKQREIKNEKNKKSLSDLADFFNDQK